jgi:hypothetical protein
MRTIERRAVTVLLTEEHLREMLDKHLINEDDIGDGARLARIVQKLLDSSLGLPNKPWHDWDDWVKGLE